MTPWHLSCEVECSWVGTQSSSVAERRDGRHVLLAQFEIEHDEVTHNSLGGHRLRDDYIAELDMPPNQCLRWRFAVGIRDGRDFWIAQQGALPERAPRLGCDAQLSVHFPQLLLLQKRMQLDLVDRGNDSRGVHQDSQMFGFEIADADRPDTALVAKMRKRLERVDERVFRRHRPVNEVEVEVLRAELVHAGVERGERALVALVGVPQLGGDEDVLTRQPGSRDRLTHLALI